MNKNIWVFVFFISAGLLSRAQTSKVSNERTGIWEINYEESNHSEGTLISAHFMNIFEYDGTYITLKWFSWSWSPYSKDGFYKFETVWRGDTLFYLNPYRIWEKLGLYKNNRYFIIAAGLDADGKEMSWSFRKITEKEVNEMDKAILEKRELYQYSTE